VAPERGALARAAGFGLVTIVFNVTQPFILVGFPLALLLIVWGPRALWSALLVGAIVGTSLMGDRSGLWWFERGWPLLLAGMFVWITVWQPAWSFSARALAALGLALAASAAIFVASPGVWLDIDTLMAARSSQAIEATGALLGKAADEQVMSLMRGVAGFQVAIFPALVAISSLGALGLAVSVRGWLAGGVSLDIGRLRSFSFSDHLVWVWLAGIAMIVAPIGQIADRIGGNAVFFMGVLYVLRGMAVLLSLIGGVSVVAGVVGSLVVLLIYPLLALILAIALIVGLGDTWLNLRSRLRPDEGGP
jgi:hypothetical protein